MEKQSVLFTFPLHQLKPVFKEWMQEVLSAGEVFTDVNSQRTILDTDQLMVKLGVTRPTLSKWRKENRIPFIQVGAVVRYDLDKVLEALENKKRRSK